MLTQEIAVFANRFNLNPNEAVWLPATFENIAKKVGMSVRGLVSEATYNNRELGEYIATTIKGLAAK